MAYIRLSEAREKGQAEVGRLRKRAAEILAEEIPAAAATFDVFLSHSFKDAEIILAIKRLAEAGGLRVYVDWIDDPSLDREHVTPETARVLQQRMRSSASLVYAHSPNASTSSWMPWELGFFDGMKPGFVWILPLVQQSDSEFVAQEYLGLYPPLERMEDVRGRLRLGFRSVTDGGEGVVRAVTLVEAVRGTGLVRNRKGW